jgi:hypothetical protein
MVAVCPDQIAVQDLDRHAATAILEQSELPGACVIRKSSSSSSGLVLSVFQRGKPKHFRIGAKGAGAFFIEEADASPQQYGTLAELVAGAGGRPPLQCTLVPLMPAKTAAIKSRSDRMGSVCNGFGDSGSGSDAANGPEGPSPAPVSGGGRKPKPASKFARNDRKPSVYLGFTSGSLYDNADANDDADV